MPLSIDKIKMKNEVEMSPKILQSTKGQTKGPESHSRCFWSKQNFFFDLQITFVSCLHCPNFFPLPHRLSLFLGKVGVDFVFSDKCNQLCPSQIPLHYRPIPDLFFPFSLPLQPTENSTRYFLSCKP